MLDGNYVCCLTVCPWNLVEYENTVFLVDSEKYMYKVQEALGAACTVGEFKYADLTPEFDYYVGDTEDGFEGTTDKTLPPTLEGNDKYISVNALFTTWEKYGS